MAKLPLGLEVGVAGQHPCGLWALDKPSGIRSHPNDRGVDPRALMPLPYDEKAQCFRDGANAYHLLNRLDAPTSGLILVATNAEVAAIVRQCFADRGVQKTYLALVAGTPHREAETWTDHLSVRKGAQGARTERGGVQESVCLMKRLQMRKQSPARALLELQPKTGRTHQLRVQCAERKLPIIGDATYGDFRLNRSIAGALGDKRLFLHAWKVKCRFSLGGEKIT